VWATYIDIPAFRTSLPLVTRTGAEDVPMEWDDPAVKLTVSATMRPPLPPVQEIVPPVLAAKVPAAPTLTAPTERVLLSVTFNAKSRPVALVRVLIAAPDIVRLWPVPVMLTLPDDPDRFTVRSVNA
jgi:hypothetical protein